MQYPSTTFGEVQSNNEAGSIAAERELQPGRPANRQGNGMPESEDSHQRGKLPAELDHVIVLVHGDLDAAAAAYQSLGFQLTPRGHHSLGSSNNLAIFKNNYLELLGYEAGKKQQRPEQWHDPKGLSGIVWRCPDPARAQLNVEQAGVKAEQPLDFVRPVETGDGVFDAAFTVLHLPREGFDYGRTFFCHHKTPELVYRPEWQVHANGVENISEFVFCGDDPRGALDLFERMFGPGLLKEIPGGFGFDAAEARVVALDRQAASERYGADAPLPEAGKTQMIGLVFKTKSLAQAEAALNSSGVAFGTAGDGLRVGPAHAFGVVIEFSE
ncbi:VOC family protein [Rhodopseudomonas palustris]|uniref:VOC family protein n=1 Tax=Rhodopseudomonas palustris TaxID=1076 RepID=UPI001F38606D|nr:VOC family protein [Rhodopseudomonas palustris]